MGLAFAGGIGMAILGFIVSIPVLIIIKAWLVDTVLDAPVALGLLSAVLALVAVTWVSQGTVWMLFSVGLLLVGCVVIPIWCERQNKIDMRELRDDDIDRYRRAIEFDPRNSSAYIFLGDALMERGSHVAAIAQYERALELSPQNATYRRKLRNAHEATSAGSAKRKLS